MIAIVRHFLLLGCCLAVNGFADTTPMIDWDKGQALYVKDCTACHGADGNATAPTFPKLAGQHQTYLVKELIDYQTNARIDPIMTPIAKKLSPTDQQNILAYIGSFKANNGGVDPNLRQLGEKLYRAGNRDHKIPACAACHGPQGAGLSEAGYPALAGQNTLYIVQQLQAFQSQKRTNDPQQIMQTIATQLSPQDMQAVASFINGLRPQ